MPKKNRDYTGLVRTPSSMAWLIRERARLKGAIDQIDKQLQQLPLERLQLSMALDALDQVIPRHEVKVDPQAIVGVRPRGPAILPYGALTKAVLQCLRKADGQPLWTKEVAYYVARVCDLDLDEVGIVRLNNLVRWRLKDLRARGLVAGLGEGAPGVFKEGRWALKAEDDLKAA